MNTSFLKRSIEFHQQSAQSSKELIRRCYASSVCGGVLIGVGGLATVEGVAMDNGPISVIGLGLAALGVHIVKNEHGDIMTEVDHIQSSQHRVDQFKQKLQETSHTDETP